jgi:hypothetical protein
MTNPEIVILPAFFATVGYVVWVTLDSWQRRQRQRLVSDFNTRLLDRLGSVHDFSEFLQTPAGSRFMADMATEKSTASPKDRILRAAQIGAVLICLGVGLLLLSFFSQLPDAMAGFEVTGAIALSLGIGFAVSAVASYRLAGSLGLMTPDVPSSTQVASAER